MLRSELSPRAPPELDPLGLHHLVSRPATKPVFWAFLGKFINLGGGFLLTVTVHTSSCFSVFSPCRFITYPNFPSRVTYLRSPLTLLSFSACRPLSYTTLNRKGMELLTKLFLDQHIVCVLSDADVALLLRKSLQHDVRSVRIVHSSHPVNTPDSHHRLYRSSGGVPGGRSGTWLPTNDNVVKHDDESKNGPGRTFQRVEGSSALNKLASAGERGARDADGTAGGYAHTVQCDAKAKAGVNLFASYGYMYHALHVDGARELRDSSELRIADYPGLCRVSATASTW